MTTSPSPPPGRLASVDAYRGLVMFLMLAEVLHLAALAKAFPDNSFWRFLAWHQTHVEWSGCTLHDLIQPSFSFLVGVAVPFSIASRLSRGLGFGRLALHAAWRALLLIGLGIFLRSLNAKQTNFTFEDTLTQIGLGYFFLFLLGFTRPVWQWAALAIILVGYWAEFALYTPPPGFSYTAVGVPADWPHNFTGFAAHWNKNSNFAWAFDRWFLNLFPRPQPFTHNAGGYATLSFIPTLGTMILGLIAGGWLRREEPASERLKRLVVAGLVCLAAGFALDLSGICPSVKRIWTPAWTLYSGGWCFLLLAGFYAVIDIQGYRKWAFVLCVIGMNSIAAYCMARFVPRFTIESLKTHFGAATFQVLGVEYEQLLLGACVLLVEWLILYWMYRRGLFLKI
jgi:predicted acyltransferase